MQHAGGAPDQTIGRRGAAAAVLALATLVLVCSTACKSSGGATEGPRPSTGGTALDGTLTVAAAASLAGVFGGLKDRFEARHPGTRVLLDLGSSGALAAQIEHGAPADVFASANAQVMEQARQAGVVGGSPTTFARNTLELVVRPGNPLGIRSLRDLTRVPVVALCATGAPCGEAAARALDEAGVALPVSHVTRGQDVKATLRQVTAGDADAAVVYVTDARTVGSDGEAVPIPAKQNVVTDYRIAALSGSTHGALARAWIAFVRGPDGRAALRDAGFLAPD